MLLLVVAVVAAGANAVEGVAAVSIVVVLGVVTAGATLSLLGSGKSVLCGSELMGVYVCGF